MREPILVINAGSSSIKFSVFETMAGRQLINYAHLRGVDRDEDGSRYVIGRRRGAACRHCGGELIEAIGEAIERPILRDSRGFLCSVRLRSAGNTAIRLPRIASEISDERLYAQIEA